MEEKAKDSLTDYYSWDWCQRTFKGIPKTPLQSKLNQLSDEIESMLDGPNESFDQDLYLAKKQEFVRTILMVTRNSKLEALAS